ncbi:MAG TPA: hypothetical protein VK508_01855 [Cyclobacteriaceae bacterium]|nr:hypothetical protein [Cyclobacteriaceae bacterium]
MTDSAQHFLFGALTALIPGIIFIVTAFKRGYGMGVKHRANRCHTRTYEDDLNDLAMMRDKYIKLDNYSIALSIQVAKTEIHFAKRSALTEELLARIKEPTE